MQIGIHHKGLSQTDTVLKTWEKINSPGPIQQACSESWQLGQMLSGVTHYHWHMGIQNTWMGTQRACSGICCIQSDRHLHLGKSSDLSLNKALFTLNSESVNTWTYTWEHRFWVQLQRSSAECHHRLISAGPAAGSHVLTPLWLTAWCERQQPCCESLSQHSSCLLVFGSKLFPSNIVQVCLRSPAEDGMQTFYEVMNMHA